MSKLIRSARLGKQPSQNHVRNAEQEKLHSEAENIDVETRACRIAIRKLANKTSPDTEGIAAMLIVSS